MFLILIILFPFFGYAQQKKDDPPKLIWSDEFMYSGAPDSTLWSYDQGNGCPSLCGWGNNEQQYYTTETKNAWVEDGKLIIKAIQEKREESTYTSARLKSIGTGVVKYGYIEVKAKLPHGRGTWAAIWMLPGKLTYGGWPKSGEIDIMEHVGFDPGVVHGTVHTEAFNHIKETQVGKQTQVDDFDSAFHRYAVNWTEDVIEFYIDGKKYHEFKNYGKGFEVWPFDRPFYVILNIAVGGNWGGQQGVDESIWPQQMEVDYVRIYEPLYTESQKLSFFNNR